MKNLIYWRKIGEAGGDTIAHGRLGVALVLLENHGHTYVELKNVNAEGEDGVLLTLDDVDGLIAILQKARKEKVK